MLKKSFYFARKTPRESTLERKTGKERSKEKE